MGPSSFLSSHGGPPAIDLSSSTMRVVTDPKMSAAAAALNSISKGENWRQAKQDDKGEGSGGQGVNGGRARGASFLDLPLPEVVTVPSAPEIRPPSVKDASISDPPATSSSEIKKQLTVYTYSPKPPQLPSRQPSPLPRRQPDNVPVISEVIFNFKSLPWRIRNGDYLEMRRPDAEPGKEALKTSQGGDSDRKAGGEALKGVSRRYERDGYIFRVGADDADMEAGHIKVPESVATAFRFQHRLEVDIYIVSVGN